MISSFVTAMPARAQKHRRGLLALAVDGHHELAALIDLELEPRAARRDDLRLEHAFSPSISVE